MKKSVLASALVLAMGVSSVAEANTAGLTGSWSGTYQFAMLSPNGGAVGTQSAPEAWTWDFDAGTIAITNTITFFGSVWTAHDVTFGDNGTNYGNADGPTNSGGLDINMLFDWSASTNIPLTTGWDVTATGNAVSDNAAVTVAYSTITAGSGDFPGFHPQFTGSLHKDTGGTPAIPVPAAVWLMGSGLIGLVGVARRRRRS